MWVNRKTKILKIPLPVNIRTSIDQVRYKDGTVLTLDLTMGGIAGGGEKQDKENGVMIIRNSFPQLVDVDNLQAVHFGNIDQWLEVRE